MSDRVTEHVRIRESTTARFVGAAVIAREYGFSTRYWIKMAAAGKIPGAHQPTGPGGCWAFDLAMFRRWWASTKREASEWQASIGGARHSGAVFKEAARSIGGHSKRDLKASLAAVLRNGSTN